MTRPIDIDWIIVGQGLAGTTLAWHLLDAGQRILVIDPGTPTTSSRIAAGLITPITGKNLALGWPSDSHPDVSDRHIAETFYRRVERRTATSFFHHRTAIRLLSDANDQRRWSARQDVAAFRAHLLEPAPTPVIDPAIAAAPHAGFAMRAAQLDVAAYLDAAPTAWPAIAASLDWHHDVSFDETGVTALGYRARGIVSCEGVGAIDNPHLAWLPFRPAKGEILTIRTTSPLPPQTLHAHGIWIAPTRAPDLFKVGATFSWDHLDTTPTPAGRTELETKLDSFFRVPYTVIDHQAAIRPIIETSRLALGRHPRQPRLAILNGLAAKGVLRAPRAAARLTAYLLHDAPLPLVDDVSRFTIHASAS